MKEKLDAVKKLLNTYNPDFLMGVDYWSEFQYDDGNKIRERFYKGKPVPEFAVRVVEACEIAEKLRDRSAPIEICQQAVKQLYIAAFYLQDQSRIDGARRWATVWGLENYKGIIEAIAQEAQKIATSMPRPELPKVAATTPAKAQKTAAKSMPIVGQTRVTLPEDATKPEFSDRKPGLVKREPDVTQIEPHVQQVKVKPKTESVATTLQERGLAIANTMTELLPKNPQISLVTGAAEKSVLLRHVVFTLEKPTGVRFSAIEGLLPEALSAAGYKPGTAFVEKLPYNQVEIYVPRPESEWEFVNFIQFFLRITGTKFDLATSEMESWFAKLVENDATPPSEEALKQLKDVVLTVHHHLKSSPYTDPSKPFKLPIGVCMKGNPVVTSLDSGVFVVGNSGGGKSNQLKSMMVTSMIMFGPPNFQAAVIDAENSAFCNFDPGNGLSNPWLKSSILGVNPSRSCEPPSRYQDDDSESRRARLNNQIAWEEDHPLNLRFMEIWRAYEQRRGRLGRHEKLREYNMQNPDDRMPIYPIFIDGLAALKQDWSEELTDFWLERGALRFRKAGMPIFAGSQYPTQKYSVPPAIRESLDVTMAFKTSENGAKLAFSEAEAAKMVSRLCGKGDFILQERGGEERYRHVQALYAPSALVEATVKILCEHYASHSLGGAKTLDKIFAGQK